METQHAGPHREKNPRHMPLHGDTRVDNYYWLRDDKRENDVLDYLRDENNYGKQIMATQQPLQNQLLKDIVGRLPPQDHSVPYVHNGYHYQSRYESGNKYAAYYRQPADCAVTDEWMLLFDANQRASHSEFYTMGSLNISPDNKVMALAEDFLSRRQYGIRFRCRVQGSWYPEV
nr:Protease 2 [Candidatus Pantoea persica]